MTASLASDDTAPAASAPARTLDASRVWRVLLLGFCLVSAVLNLWALTNWQRGAIRATSGTLGLRLGPTDSAHRFPILAVLPGSPLAGLGGALPGDTLVYDHPADQIRQLGTDELVGLTLHGPGGVRHRRVQPMPNPASPADGSRAWSVAATWAAHGVGLLVASVLALRRPDSPAMRALSLALALGSWDVFPTRLPAGQTQDVLVVLGLARYALMALALVYFAIVYPARPARLRQASVRWLFAGLAALYLLSTALMVATVTNQLPGAWGPGWPLILGYSRVLGIVARLLVLGLLWASWRRATGMLRHRLAWIGLCLGLELLSWVLMQASVLAGMPLGLDATLASVGGMQLAAACGLASTLLRHRVFGFGFASNRLAVWLLSALGMAAVIAAVQAVLARLPALPGHPAGPGRPDRPDHGAGGRVCAAAQAGRAHRAGQLVSRLACP